MFSLWHYINLPNSVEVSGNLSNTESTQNLLSVNEDQKTKLNNDPLIIHQEEGFQKILKKLNELEESVNKSHVINNLFAFKPNLVDTDSISFTKIITIYLKLIESVKKNEEKIYICLGMFYYINDHIPKLDYIKYHNFFKIVLDKIKESQFTKNPLFDEIRCKLKDTIEKKIHSNNNNHQKSD